MASPRRSVIAVHCLLISVFSLIWMH